MTAPPSPRASTTPPTHLRVWSRDRQHTTEDGIIETVPLAAFIAALRRHATDAVKIQGRVWSPALFRRGHKSASVEECSGCVVLDLDHKTEVEITDVMARLERLDLAHVWHTTWRHAPETVFADGSPNPDIRIRLVVLLTTGYPARRHTSVHVWVDAMLGGHVDPQCRDLGQLYNAPQCPADRLSYARSGAGGTWYLDPSDAPEVAVKPPTRLPSVLRQVDDDRLRRVAKKWSRDEGQHKQGLGVALGCVLAGLPFAEPSERNDVSMRLCFELARSFPDLDPDRMSARFAKSLGSMGSDAPTCVDVADMLRRGCQAVHEERSDAVTAEQRALAARIREARGGASEEAYSEAELAEMRGVYGYTEAELRHRWVVQHRRCVYLLGPRGYHEYSVDDVAQAAQTDLSPCTSAGVDLHRVLNGERVPLGTRELVTRYGTVVEGVDLSLTAERTTVVGRRMVEAPCPLAPLRPTHHADVHEWLTALTPHPEVLLSWVAHVTLLDRPCAALVLIGPKGSGKSLLPQGLARLWGRDAPTSLSDVAGAFTESVTRCPLLFADEALPRDWRGRVNTGWLRELIQARSQSYRRKYRDTGRVEGCVRIVVAANDLSVLETGEDLSSDDVAAIAERYAVLRVSPEVSDRMASTPRATIERWCEGGAIAEHALWLRDTICPTYRADGRFLVRGPESETTQRLLATRSGPGAWLTQLLGLWILEPQRVPADLGRGKVSVDPTGVRVSAEFAEAVWDLYLLGRPKPSSRGIARTLATLGSPTRIPGPRGTVRARATSIDLDAVRTWCDDTGRVGPDEWESVITRLTKHLDVALAAR